VCTAIYSVLFLQKLKRDMLIKTKTQSTHILLRCTSYIEPSFVVIATNPLTPKLFRVILKTFFPIFFVSCFVFTVLFYRPTCFNNF